MTSPKFSESTQHESDMSPTSSMHFYSLFIVHSPQVSVEALSWIFLTKRSFTSPVAVMCVVISQAFCVEIQNMKA